MPVSFVARKPENLSFEEAGGLPLVGLTAYQALFFSAGLTAGERVLVQAAAGGVGTMAVQLAVDAGAEVIGVASEANRDRVIELGAYEVIDRSGLRARGRQGARARRRRRGPRHLRRRDARRRGARRRPPGLDRRAALVPRARRRAVVRVRPPERRGARGARVARPTTAGSWSTSRRCCRSRKPPARTNCRRAGTRAASSCSGSTDAVLDESLGWVRVARAPGTRQTDAPLSDRHQARARRAPGADPASCGRRRPQVGAPARHSARALGRALREKLAPLARRGKNGHRYVPSRRAGRDRSHRRRPLFLA